MNSIDLKKINKYILKFSIIYTLFQYYLTNYLEILPSFFNGIDDLLIVYLLISTLISYKRIELKCNYRLLVFFYLSIISFVINEFSLKSYLMSIKDLLRFYFLFMLFKVYFNKTDLNKMINQLGYFVIISSLFAVFQFVTFVPANIPGRNLVWDSGVGFFGYGTANMFSVFNGICFYIFYLNNNITSKRRILFCLFSIIGLLVGCSKAGIIIFLILTIMYNIKNMNIKNITKKNIKQILTSFLVVSITMILMNIYFEEEFKAILDIEGLINGQIKQTDTGRLSWVNKYEKSIKTIFLGDGPGQVISFAAQKTESPKLERLSPGYILDSRFENDLLMIILEYGIIATYIYILIIKQYMRDDIEIAINYIILTSLVCRVFQTQFTSLLISIILFIKYLNNQERNTNEEDSYYNKYNVTI